MAGWRRRAHDRDEVVPFAVFSEAVGFLAECVAQTHDVAGKLQALGAKGGAKEIDARLALVLGQSEHAYALANEGIHVVPHTPLRIVDGVDGFCALLRSERSQKSLGGFAHRFGGHAS